MSGHAVSRGIRLPEGGCGQARVGQSIAFGVALRSIAVGSVWLLEDIDTRLLRHEWHELALSLGSLLSNCTIYLFYSFVIKKQRA